MDPIFWVLTSLIGLLVLLVLVLGLLGVGLWLLRWIGRTWYEARPVNDGAERTQRYRS